MKLPRPAAILLPVLLGGLVLLSGCSSQRIVQCPGAVILADAASIHELRAGGPADLSGVMVSATFSDVRTVCSYDRKEGKTNSSLDIVVRATRPSSAAAASFTVPYFVAVTQADRIISKSLFTMRIDFAPGVTSTIVTDSVDQTTLRLERGHPPTDYQLMAGFQLTDAQREFNASMSRYTP